jgi:threonine/homoserine/homoserine lactone efflux protein
LVLTLTNPMTILSFVAMFAGCGVGSGSGYGAAVAVVFGVFAGSALWWVILSGGVTLLRARVGQTWLRAVNWISGTIIFAFGVFALFNGR